MVPRKDSKMIYFTAENETLSPIYALDARGGAEPKKIVAEGFNTAVSISRDGKILAFERTSLTMPPEVVQRRARWEMNAQQVTHHNDTLLAQLDMHAPETFWFEGAGGSRVQAMLLRPPKFSATKKYPLLVLLHGGPQTMWSNAWGYRWNAQVFSAAGYVTLMINRHGSTGYGQKFTDEITNDWGGQAYTYVMKGVDYALANNKFIDGSRMAVPRLIMIYGRLDRQCIPTLLANTSHCSGSLRPDLDVRYRRAGGSQSTICRGRRGAIRKPTRSGRLHVRGGIGEIQNTNAGHRRGK